MCETDAPAVAWRDGEALSRRTSETEENDWSGEHNSHPESGSPDRRQRRHARKGGVARDERALQVDRRRGDEAIAALANRIQPVSLEDDSGREVGGGEPARRQQRARPPREAVHL